MDTQFEAAESHAPAPMPRRRAADRAMHALIAGRLEWLRRFPIARWAPVPLRLIVGYGFMEHGFAKLARGPDAFPAILQALGVPAPHLMGWLTIGVEIVGGLFVLLGALIPLASIPMAAVLLVAMITVHLPYGFSSIKLQAVTAAGAQFGPPGFETNLLYLACLAALVLGGSGPLAIEGLLAKRREVARSSSDAEPSAGCRGAAGPDGATARCTQRPTGKGLT
jgi:putative oxidoreductase